MVTNVESVKKWRDRHINAGLCRYCTRKAKKGRTMCQYHLDYLKWRKKFVVKKQSGGDKDESEKNSKERKEDASLSSGNVESR